MSEEKWRAYVGFEDLYEVSDCGGVRSLDRVVGNGKGGERKLKGRVLKPSLTSGYATVYLSRDGSVSPGRVHSLMLRAFVGEPEPGHEGREFWRLPSIHSGL